MAHDILGNMFSGTASAWHSLGIVDSAILTATDGMNRGGMNYDIHKVPLTAIMPDGTQIPTSVYGLMREPVTADPQWRDMGTCGGDYDFWQNRDVSDRIDMLSESTQWSFSTCGVLAKGATYFVCLDMGRSGIAGEDYDRFFTYIETRDGKTRSWGLVSRIRVVCRNTCNLALKSASGKIGIRHDTEYKSTADWAMDIVAKANRSGESVDAALNLLAQIGMDDEKISSLLSAIAPMPEMPAILTMPNLSGRMAEKRESAEIRYDRAIKASARVRETVMANYSGMDIAPALRDTAMHAFQAVTQYTTHQHGTLGARGRKMDSASRADYDLMGGGQAMRDMAYTALTADLD